MKIKYLLHELTSTDTTRIVRKPADLTGFKACWITFHLVLIFLTYSCLLKLMTMYISYPAWNAALSDALWQSLWQRPRTNTSLNRHEIFRFLSYFIIFAPFSIFLIIKSVCIRCLCLRLIHSAERKKKTCIWTFFFFCICGTATSISNLDSRAHQTAHGSECVILSLWRRFTVKRVNREWTLCRASRALDAYGEGREKEEAERLLWR